MRDALKSYLALAAGVTDLTRQRALAAAKALVTQGEATAEQVGGLAEDLLAQTRQNREAVVALVAFEVDRALGRVGLATADGLDQLTARVHELEQQLQGLTAPLQQQAPQQQAPTEPSSIETATAERAPSRRAPAKGAPAKTAPAKKAPFKGAPAKKAPAKKASAKGASAKGAPAELTPSRTAPGGTGSAGTGFADPAEA